jgi:hypothetical protein
VGEDSLAVDGDPVEVTISLDKLGSYQATPVD